LEWKLSAGVLERLKMIDIEKLKEDKEKAHEKLSEAWNAISPEYTARMQKEREIEIEFLSSWKDYKNNKLEQGKFLYISDKFAEIIHEEKEMRTRCEKIIQPLQEEYEKTWKILDDLENKHD
jgi:rubrerythrin